MRAFKATEEQATEAVDQMHALADRAMDLGMELCMAVVLGVENTPTGWNIHMQRVAIANDDRTPITDLSDLVAFECLPDLCPLPEDEYEFDLSNSAKTSLFIDIDSFIRAQKLPVFVVVTAARSPEEFKVVGSYSKDEYDYNHFEHIAGLINPSEDPRPAILAHNEEYFEDIRAAPAN